MFKKGVRVKVTGCYYLEAGFGEEGVIEKESKQYPGRFLVKFDDRDFIDRWWWAKELSLIES